MTPTRTLGVLALLIGLWTAEGLAQATPSPHGKLTEGLECSSCHTPEAWSPLKKKIDFDHDRRTSFVLTGKHAEAACSACHLKLHFDEPKFSTADCASCHLDVHKDALSDDCAGCHNTVAFDDLSSPDLHAKTSFPLVGAHLQTACQTCHIDDTGGAFSTLDTDCATCHLEEYQTAASIDHVERGFSTECQKCHSPLAWSDVVAFEHAVVANGFALVGAHARLQCENCHIMPDLEPIFAPAGQNDCITCHQDDYQLEHEGSGFATTCLDCHTTDTWVGPNFDHAIASNGFELVGGHSQLGCESCHLQPGNELIFTPTNQEDCVACHLSDFEREHTDDGFPDTCLDCHTVDTWEAATFDHASASNGFDLIGRHEQLACSSCHIQPGNQSIFDPADQNDCVACHLDDFQREHADEGFADTCLDCHTVDTWEGATFDHASATNGFDLVGAHNQLPCSSCHIQPGNQSIFDPADQNDCVACHLDDFQREHADEGFADTCLDCHTVDTWEGATFDHVSASNGYDLVGAHDQLPCSACHIQPGNQTIFNPADQNDCVACHMDDYQQQHAGTGFPTDCLICHTNDTWMGAVFDHTFPIDKGPHSLEKRTCSDCHIDPNNTQVFECILCHDHNQQKMDDKHSEEPGYVWESQACLSCHPNGKKE